MFQCPHCKNAEPEIKITALVLIDIYVDGNEEVWESEPGDLEWDDTTKAECVDCGHIGTVKDMTIEDPEEIAQQEEDYANDPRT